MEAQSAYEEAHNAVFHLQLTWRHTQPHRSRRDGKTRWSMIEMWPMHVSQVQQTLSVTTALVTKQFGLTLNHPYLEGYLQSECSDW